MFGEKKAFTLVEVLITLGIIGIIASMTIAPLLQSIEEAELKAAFKRIYGELAQATLKIRNANGGTLVGAFSNSGPNNHDNLRDEYTPYLNTVKNCNAGAVSGLCWHIHDGTGHWKQYDGSNVTAGLSLQSGQIFNNGAFVNYIYTSTSCDHDGWGSFSNAIMCGWLIIDVNGFKSPNVIGKDIFYLYIDKDKLGVWGDDNSTTSTCSGLGAYCAASNLYK